MSAIRSFFLTPLIALVLVSPLAAQAVDPLRQAPPVLGQPDNLAAIKRLDGEYIILIGGPALREWEVLRRKYQQHDRWWANFLAGGNIRTRQLLAQGVPASSITWVVYKPGYISRGREEGKPLVSWVGELAAKNGVKLAWFDDQSGLIRQINNRGGKKIVSLDFFGHSNRHCFLFDYSNHVMGASSVWLHENDLRKLNRSAFDRRAFCKSWGCHTGESMSAKWKSAVGVSLYGALGKTDYVPTGNGQLPVLSTAAGVWSR